jgi:hypothetical protein
MKEAAAMPRSDQKPIVIVEKKTFLTELTNVEPAIRGSGVTADDVADEADPHEQDLLDEGLEETFPASDPVSAKHIT